MSHIPAMLQESLACFRKKKIRTFFDGTVGAGGFASALLSEHPEIERYYGCDRDDEALVLAQKCLSKMGAKVVLFKGNFCYLDALLAERGVREVDGFFLILGFHRCS